MNAHRTNLHMCTPPALLLDAVEALTVLFMLLELSAVRLDFVSWFVVAVGLVRFCLRVWGTAAVRVRWMLPRRGVEACAAVGPGESSVRDLNQTWRHTYMVHYQVSPNLP